MKPIIKKFAEKEISPEATMRTILLFGRNVSTYKFALADVLLKSGSTKSLIKYQDLRDEFIRELYNHYVLNPFQYQGGSNSITKAFDQYTTSKDWNLLTSVAERNIYNNVFDAFHNVGGSSIKDKYTLFEHDPKNKQIILTDNLMQLLGNTNYTSQLIKENQSRWNIVEEAWKNNLSPNLLVYDKNESSVFSINEGQERVNLRSAVDVLLPYQLGRCFYCNKKVDVNTSNDDNKFPDVDHVIPFSAFNRQLDLMNINSNGLWNLVVSCKECNRGADGKFDSPPDKSFYYNLIERNVLFTQEHRHSLKNTILLSLGVSTSEQVESKMYSFYTYFEILNGWKPKSIYSYE